MRRAASSDKTRPSRRSPAAPPAPIFPRLAVAGLLIAATLAAFWPVLSGTFLDFDDQDTVALNPDFLHPESAKLSHYFTQAHQGLYIPVTYVTWYVIAQGAHEEMPTPPGSALSPRPFHAMNLVLHVGGVLWVYAILLLLLPAGPAWRRAIIAGIAAGLFALHPLQAEAVAWITSMNTVLSAMLSLWAVWHYLVYSVLATNPESQAIRRRIHWTSGLVLFTLALLAKPSVVVIPAVAGVLALWPLKRPWRAVVVSLLPWIAVAIPIAIVTRLVQPAVEVTAPPWIARPMVAADAVGFYLIKLIAPLRLSPDYGRIPAEVTARGWASVTCLIAVLLLVAGLVLRRKLPVLLTALLIIVVTLLPVLGLTPFQFQTFSTVADRYFYLALLGPSLLLGLGLSTLGRLRPELTMPTLAVAGLIVPVLGIMTYRQAAMWQNDNALFAHTLAINPGSLAAHQVLGFTAARRGDFAEALSHYQQALKTHPGNGVVEYNWGNLLLRTAHPDEAIPHFVVAERQLPGSAELRNSFGIALAQTHHEDAALAEFQKAAELKPNAAETEANIAMILAMKGDHRGAYDHYRRALELNPNLPSARRGMQRLLDSTGKTPH